MAYLGHDDSWLRHGGIYQICTVIVGDMDESPNVILDMGSRHGEGFDEFGRYFTRSKYVFVEPAPECIVHLLDIKQRYFERDIAIVPGVLGSDAGSTMLLTFPGDDDQSSNLYSDRGEKYGAPVLTSVNVYPYSTLDSYGDIGFAKVNIEGAEYDLMDDGFFDRVDNFVMEVHNGLVHDRGFDYAVEALKDSHDLVSYGNTRYKYCYLIGRRC